MKQNGWRWLGWSVSVLVLILVGIFWSQFSRIEEGGALRIWFSAIGWLAMFGTVFSFPNLSRRWGVILILFAAVVVRISFWGAPVSDDVNRYLWEGRLLWMDENPYAMRADDESWAHLRDGYWEDMNTRDRMTAYPPGMELVMAGASWLWYDLKVFKVVALMGDLWVLALLVILSRDYLRPIRWLGFYAFNPIVISSFAVEAHFDSMMVAPMLTALLFATRQRWRGAWFWLGIAVQMKMMALLLVPLLLIGEHRRATRRLLSQPLQNFGAYILGVMKGGWPFALVLVLPSLIFWEHLGGMFYGLFAFGRDGAFNGGFYELLRLLGVSGGSSRLVGTLLFGVGVTLVFWSVLKGREKDLLTAAFRAFLLLLVFSPIVHFWYLTWVVWFLVLRPSKPLLLLCGTCSVYFLAWVYGETDWGWGYPREVVVATWVPFFMLLAWELRHVCSRSKQKGFPAVQSLSVVVPVYREGPQLPRFLSKLEKVSEGIREVIVVDGAAELDEEKEDLGHGVRLVHSERGRGRQIARGIDETTGDLVVILHADTEPREGWVREVLRAVNKMPEASAFALGQRFGSRSVGLLGVEMLNESRVVFGSSVFGDQTMMIRRSALEKIGGFPQQPLMEDVEVSLRLNEIGRIEYLGMEWEVSARKWDQNFKGRFWTVIWLMMRYHWTRRRSWEEAAELSEQLFKEYYPSGKKEEK